MSRWCPVPQPFFEESRGHSPHSPWEVRAPLQDGLAPKPQLWRPPPLQHSWCAWGSLFLSHMDSIGHLLEPTDLWSLLFLCAGRLEGIMMCGLHCWSLGARALP